MLPGRQPKAPTSAIPGTDAKIRVLSERASRMESLHHPDDARIPFHIDPTLEVESPDYPTHIVTEPLLRAAHRRYLNALQVRRERDQKEE